jgi:hypothetical protein
MRIENEELAKKEMKTQVMTYEGERERDTMSNNKLINTTTEYDERNSVCSCNCMGTSSGTENGQLLIDGYLPTDLVTSSLSLKRASV